MSRSSTAFTVFFATALVAMSGMIVVGRMQLHRTAAKVMTAGSPAPRSRPGTPPTASPDIDDPTVGVGLPPGYRSTNARNYARMRLRELTMAEEQFYNETSSYTTDLTKLQLMKRTGDVVILRIISAGPAGWSAEATHPAMPGKSCVTYAGPASQLPKVPETMADHTPPLGERDMVCDKP